MSDFYNHVRNNRQSASGWSSHISTKLFDNDRKQIRRKWGGRLWEVGMQIRERRIYKYGARASALPFKLCEAYWFTKQKQWRACENIRISLASTCEHGNFLKGGDDFFLPAIIMVVAVISQISGNPESYLHISRVSLQRDQQERKDQMKRRWIFVLYVFK